MRTTAPMLLRSGYGVDLFNSNGSMLLFSDSLIGPVISGAYHL